MTFRDVIVALLEGKKIECKLKTQKGGWYLLREEEGNELSNFYQYDFRLKK